MLNIVATPIGNLQDLSYRQIRTIASAEILLAEDTRSAGILLEKMKGMYDISRNPLQRVISYYKEKEFEKLPEIIGWLQAGKEVVLISESGMPVLSDPGLSLVRAVISYNIPFSVVPGATAVTTALLHSGFDLSSFVFIGFLPKKPSDLKKLFSGLKIAVELLPSTVFAYYDSPLRLGDNMRVLNTYFPDAKVAVCRELTKQFEEVLRGVPTDFFESTFKGEVTIVVQPKEIKTVRTV